MPTASKKVMLITPHALAGIVIVSKIGNPALSLPLTLLSHVALDKIPHWNWRPAPQFFNLLATAVDSALALAAVYFFSKGASQPWVTALGGLLPATLDIFDIPYYFFGWGGIWEKYTQFSRSYQARAGVLPGIVTQLLFVDLCLFLLLF